MNDRGKAQGGPQEAAPPAPTEAIRRAAAEGLPIIPGQVLALLDHIDELESALDLAEAGQQLRAADARIAELEDRERKSTIVIKDLARLREEAKEEVYRLRAADRTIEQLRIAGLRVLTEIGADDDSSDNVRMLESLCKYNDDRKRAEFPLLDAIRAYLDAVDREGDVAAALSRLRRAVEG